MKKQDGQPNLPIKKENALPQSTNQLIRKATINEKALSNILGNRNPEFWLQKARTALDKEAWQEAIIYAEKALFYEATFIKADIVLAYAFGRLRDIDKSLFYMEKVDRFGEVEAEVYRSLLSREELYFLSIWFEICNDINVVKGGNLFSKKLELFADLFHLSFDEDESYTEINNKILKNPKCNSLRYFGGKYSSPELPGEICKLQELIVLKLHYSNIKKFPKEISSNKLLYLEVDRNHYISIPINVTGLQNIVKLHIYESDVFGLFSNSEKMLNLTSLSWRWTGMDNLPSGIGGLKNLMYLNLEGNNLSSLPPEIGQLKNLRILRLDQNNLESLPSEIGGLINLTSLDLDEHSIKILPSTIGNLINLTSLGLSDNNLTSLPKEIGNLINLTFLNLSDNNLTSLPIEITKLEKLDSLSISSKNDLDKIIPIISRIKNLNHLCIVFDKDLSNKIGELSNISSLTLIGKNLNNLPTEIGELTNLRFLSLAGLTDYYVGSHNGEEVYEEYEEDELNLKVNIFPEIGRLINLTSLSLSDVDNSVFLSEIGKLTNLTSLKLSSNQLTSLPKEIGQLTNLTDLYLNGNNFSVTEKKRIKNLLPNCEIKY